jgi:hypothetical protein
MFGAIIDNGHRKTNGGAHESRESQWEEGKLLTGYRLLPTTGAGVGSRGPPAAISSWNRL